MKLLQTFIFCIITISIYAQKNQPDTNIEAEKTNWINFKAAEQVAASQLVQNKTALQLQDKDNLNLIAEQSDQLGMRHYRYQQTYDGIPIEGAIYILHEKENRVKTANGKLIHQLNLNTVPSISVDAALTSALTHIDAERYAWDDPMHENGIKEVKNQADATFYPSGKLVIIDPEFEQQNTNCKLAYKFDIYAVQPYTRQEVFVDAHDGSIITSIEKIHNCTDVPATGTSNYHGTVGFTACQHDETHTLKNNIGGGMQVFYDNYEDDDTEFSEYPFTSESDSFQNMHEAIDVHWATEQTYNYFLDTYDRNSLDDEGMLLKSWVHHDDNLNNAAWTGWCMFYGDGDGNEYSSWTTPDIVAHEIAHGITEFTANLIYQNESGALSESFSDIFGEMVEWTATGGNDWLIGADLIQTPGINGLRSMSNPKAPDAKYKQPDTYRGQYWYTGSDDFGGVHINSGVQNHWFYLLSEGGAGTNDHGHNYSISGIGKTKAAAIAYHNLTQYLSNNSNYEDARAGAIEAAIQLYGPDSNEAIQTEQAWCAVGVGPECGPILNPCIENDSLALVALYNATDGPNWTNTWDLNQPMDTWHGVKLNEDRCVEDVSMSSNNLNGNIPAEIGNLSHLTRLAFYNNQLNGNIPSEIGNLTNLTTLNLNLNQLSGNIPAEIGNLSNLTRLGLISNQLSGNIPQEIGNLSSLIYFWLNNNQVSGNIPTEIGNLSNLEYFYLDNNQLSGNIPAEIGNLNNLIELYFNNNQLSGNIPPEIGNLSSLVELALNDNQLSGNIPPEIENMSRLESLSFSNNQLSGNIPPEIENMSNLEYFYFDNNQLSGNIPSQIANMSSLKGLRINNNQLSGCYSVYLASLCGISSLYISEGNNFDESWDNFCDDGTGSCMYTTCSQNDSLALIALYNTTNGADWTNTWDLNLPIYTWYGVTLNELGCVKSLELYNNNLVGTIPPEIGNLSNLSNLSLGNNELSSTIPPEIGNLSNLTYLALYGNQLSGNIPPEIGNLSSLITLVSSENQLSGNIPAEIGNLSSLTELTLSNNQLSGNIPAEIGNLSNLTQVSLYYNQLSGNIPPEIGNLSSLTSLGFAANQLSGNIPIEIGNLSQLTYLHLENNQLSGNIPAEIGNLNRLFSLHLENNQLSGNIPSEIGNLIQLSYLHLNNNQLIGNIPAEIGNLNKLTRSHLDYNQLNGNIPPEIGNLSYLLELKLDYNQLSDNIPFEIGNLSKLIHLSLRGNQLSGNIPPQIGNLSNLGYLGLNDNQLSGNIPPEIGNLSNLNSLHLHRNQLSGNIPQEIGNLSYLTDLRLFINQLSGCYHPNLSNLCGQLTEYYISNGNNFDATWDDFCNTGEGSCPPNPVLPGDFNNDGVADQHDILYWGLAEGYSGAARPTATAAWVPQECPEWDGYINGVNLHHSDADGNGTIDNNDLSILEQNFGQTTQSFSASSQSPSSSIFLMSQLSKGSLGDDIVISYELHLKSNVPISTHGISGSIDLSNMPGIISASIDTTGSALRPDAYVYVYDSNQKVVNIGLTKTSKNNQSIDGSIGVLSIIVTEDFQIGDPLELRTNGGSMISSNGLVTPIATSTLYAVPNSATPDLPVSLSLNDAYCGLGGTATSYVWEGTAPYTYAWSTGENTASVSNLPPGTHSLTVTDAGGLSKAIDFEIEWAFTPIEVTTSSTQICISFDDAPLTKAVQVSLDNGLTYQDSITSDTCYDFPEDPYHIWIQSVADQCPVDLAIAEIIEPNCINLQLYAWMEGAYDSTTFEMNNDLNTYGLLPGKTPWSDLATPTPAGQPYNTAPWNYTGTEGTTWTDADYSTDMVDWVLISFRTDIEKSSEIDQAAAIIHQDGSINFINRCGLETIEGVDSVYVVVEHRNHMGIMTPDKVEIVNDSVTYDFRTSDSYRTSASVGQKQLATGEWVMFAGDADQSDLPSYDIIGTDKSIWTDQNGSFGNYTVADFDLDGDVNGADKGLWSENNGSSSRVPK